jgi:hypothetical protein
MLKTIGMKAESKAIQMKSFFSARATHVKSFLKQKSGEGAFTDVVMIIVIVAVVGALLLGALKLFFPGLIEGVMTKVQDGIDGVDLFDGTTPSGS